MKKKLIALLAGALMTVAMAGSAFAYFEDTTLTRVVWNTGAAFTTEQHVDLGSVSALTAASYNATLATGDAGWDDMFSAASTTKVAYFAQDRSNGNFWVSAAPGATIFLTPSGLGPLSGYTENVQLNDHSSPVTVDGTVAEALISKTNTNSYKSQFGTGGKMKAYNITVEMSLASAATQDLYFFDIANGVLTGRKVATITTNLDGSTTVSHVPVPAAVYLLGSGLLGLVGLRRRIKE